MKYNDKNKPLVCMMTQSTCYKGTRKFTPKGVLWHSTGANNPWLKRYVQPDDNAANRSELLNLLGKNQYGNDWNHIEREAGLNFWIGKLADGTVAAVQTMPWDYRPWGCGSGNNGSCNNTHIQFEICEDGLNDKSYWEACYKEACEMTAYLCKMFGIDPKGTTVCNGVTVPTIIDHTGSHALGLGSNHGDVQHWSRKYGKTMENVRNDVAALLAGDDSAVSTSVADSNLTKGSAGEAVKTMQTMLIACGYSCGAILKPFTRETLEMTMSKIRYLSCRLRKEVYIQTFGRFVVLKNGKPLPLRGKTKEILALVVIKRGREISNEEIYNTVWEERAGGGDRMNVYYNALHRLRRVLKNAGYGNLLIATQRGQMVNVDCFTCDYYEWLDGNADMSEKFTGEFLSEYSWSEAYLADMLRHEDDPGSSL